MKQRSRQQLLAIAAASLTSVAIIQSIAQLPVLAHQVQTNYILNDATNRFIKPQTPTQAANQAPARTGTSIELQSEFANGEPLKGANVVIYAPNQPGRIWGKGITDSEGRFDFEPDTAIQGDWEVQIARAGHADILTVPVSDRGIEADLVSQEGASDLHYAQTSPWALVGAVAVAAICVGSTRINSKRKAV